MIEGLTATSPPKTITGDTPCPICGYNMRGLSEPNCPECGSRFTWNEIFDPTRRIHSYLFEHHPERNIHSFLRTFLGALRPTRFWKSLHPNQPLCVRRLWLYFLLILIPTIGFPIVFTLGSEVALKIVDNMEKREDFKLRHASGRLDRFDLMILRRYPSVDAYLDKSYPTNPATVSQRVMEHNRSLLQAVCTLGAVTFAPIFTLIVFLVFKSTLSKARLNANHIVRTVAYNSGILLIMGPIVGACSYLFPDRSRYSVNIDYDLLMLMGVAALLIFSASLLIASVRYLRFNRAFAVAFSTQVVVYLIVGNVWLIVEIWGR